MILPITIYQLIIHRLRFILIYWKSATEMQILAEVHTLYNKINFSL